MIKLKVSPGNSKMGEIPSVSLPPIVTCRPDAPCKKDCYACKLCRIYKTVKSAYQSNLDLLNADRDGYFNQLKSVIAINKYFRLHVSGDIPDADYFSRVVEIAGRNPETQILMFTKQYEIVNDYINYYHSYDPYTRRVISPIPENLKIILSAWGEWRPENPYNLPVSDVIFKGQPVPDNYLICGGNCSNCACRGVGCWQLKNGQTIAFYKH